MLSKLKKVVAEQTAANGGKPRRIEMADTLFRDAHQCVWATRMSTEHMLPIAPVLDNAGFEVLECMGLVQYDGAVRFLNQNPLERLRLLGERMPKTPIRSIVRGNLMGGFAPVHSDVTDLFVERQVANGASELLFFETLHDWNLLAPGVKRARELGANVTVAIIYNHAPGYDDDYYAEVARQSVEQLNPDKIMLADAGGIMTLERIRTLLPVVRQAIGDTKLEFNTHCLTGLGPVVALEAAVLGADTIYTVPEPLAGGNAAPGSQMIARNLRELGYEVGVDISALEKIEEYLHGIARREDKPISYPGEYNEKQYVTQIAGGALSNVESQLIEAGIHHRLPEVIEEIGRVRLELGSPAMATPYPAIIAAQAVMNVVQDKRYSIVPVEMKKYVCGYYGELRIPVDTDVVDRVIENGPRDIPNKPQPLGPLVPGLRKRYPNIDDDELLLRYMYGDERIDGLSPTRVEEEFSAEQPLVELVKGLVKHKRKAWVHMSGADFALSVGPQG